MAKFNWKEVTKEDVIKAIRIFEEENPVYPEPRSTFLLYNGKKYPAKHIRGMAYRVHFGQEIRKGDYTGGQETVNFFDKLGFEMQYKHKNVDTHPGRKIVGDDTNHETSKPMDMEKNGGLRPVGLQEKVKIPVKGVIEQKNALQLILNRLFDGDVVCEKTFPWMKTPSELSGEYKNLYDALSAYRGNEGFAKKNVSLRCDFVCESRKLIIEYDERQHFSEARRISLQSYPEVHTFFDRKLWIHACRDIQAKDNQPANRDETRAFYDSTRDIEAARHGYALVRIMHGQVDFKRKDAADYVRELLDIQPDCTENGTTDNKDEGCMVIKHGDDTGMLEPSDQAAKPGDIIRQNVKIGLYLQTNELYGDKEAFNSAMSIVRSSDIDILVLPEFSYIPFEKEYRNADFLNGDDVQGLYDKTLELSRDIRCAVVICNEDKYGTIMSIYANSAASEDETRCRDYIKHTMTNYSACEITNYRQYAEEIFQPVIYKGNRIGMTICYDCNHSIFSRKYGMNGVDIILNSTGGNVVYDKWYKYNKARAIENHCFTFVTMGGDGTQKNPHNYVYGFTPEGKEMHPLLLNGQDNGKRNFSGGIYVYDTADDDGMQEDDSSIDQKEKVNKKCDLSIAGSDLKSFVGQGKKLIDDIVLLPYKGMNVILCCIDGMDIMKPEKILKLLYAKELKKLPNKRYMIINFWDDVETDFYRTQLSLILKVRAMENFCAVILSSGNLTKCYQCGNNRTAQVVKAENGQFGIDLARTGGPETIWRNKDGMKAAWRDNIEWLIDTM